MGDNENKVLIFGLNGEKYATDIKDVERILGYQEPTILPETPDFVKGVINHEESIIPIISLSEKFKLGKDNVTESSKIIVVKRKEKKFGVIVENVYEVTDLGDSFIEEAPEIVNLKERNYIKGLLRIKNNIIITLDLDKVLSLEDEDSIF